MKNIHDYINDLTQRMYNYGVNCVNYENKILQKANIPKVIRFDINLDTDVNAQAIPLILGSNSVGYGITINRGLIFNIHTLASVLLSKSDVMPELGENEFEFGGGKIGLDEIKWGNNLNEQILQLADENIKLISLSSKRTEVLNNVVWGAFLFALYHEIGHAQRTHVDWYYSLAMEALKENRDTHYLPAISSQALELSADAHASLMLAGIISESENQEDLARQYGFGMGLLFETFDMVFSPLKNYSDLAHPHPGIRFMYTCLGFSGRASKYGIELPTNIQKSIEKGFFEAAISCDTINSETVLKGIMNSPIECHQKMEEILDELDRITTDFIPKWSW